MERYQRQLALKEWTEKHQLILKSASVLVIGAGGLGCAIAPYLAGAGVQKIGVVDNDTVAVHNLHRQVMFSTADVGKNKAECLVARLQELNPNLVYEAHAYYLTSSNSEALLSAYDLIVDGTDNFPTRYLVNDTCRILEKPLVFGAISQWEGQVAVFHKDDSTGVRTNYRDLYPNIPRTGVIRNCEEAGVLGPLVGIVGSAMAAEVLKVLTGVGKPLVNQLWTYNLMTHSAYTIHIRPRPESFPVNFPTNLKELLTTNYGQTICAQVEEIESDYIREWVNRSDVTWLDVREPYEEPILTVLNAISFPLSQINEMSLPACKANIIVFCQAGVRSKKAIAILQERYPSYSFKSVKGGIATLQKLV